jgi:hypothetical protein
MKTFSDPMVSYLTTTGILGAEVPTESCIRLVCTRICLVLCDTP